MSIPSIRPSSTDSFALPPLEAESTQWLLQLNRVQVDECMVVRLTDFPERAKLEPTTRGSSVKPQLSLALAPDLPEEGASLATRLKLLLAVPLDLLLPGPGTTLEWPGQLFDYQLDGVQALIANDRLLLADDMGLGKTIQAAAAIRILCIQRQIQNALLVVPASLLDQWRREIHKWAPELRAIVVRGNARDRIWQWQADAHVTIVSYETLRADFTDNPQSPPRKRVWDLVVLDEAQKIKNRDVEVSRECKLLQRDRSWAMTGTPLENKIEDLASILEFVDHKPGDPPRRLAPGPELLERHKQLQLRRRKMEVLDQLPPKQVIHIDLPLMAEQQLTYDKAEQEGILQLKEKGAEVRIQHVLELILRLKQICNFCPRTGESSKVADIKERLSVLTDEGNRALIFSQFTDDTFGVEAISKAVEEHNPLTYTGSMSSSGRDRTIQTFKQDSRHHALVLSLKAGGIGLNLQEASYVFHLDRWWNPATERQAEDRSHRMGQTVPVTVFKYTCMGTIEERIQATLDRKQKLFEDIVDDVSIDIASQLTSQELYGLFDMEPPSSEVRTKSVRPSGLDLEARCATLLKAHGWTVELTPQSRDGGVDLVAERTDEVGVTHRLYVQCKDHARPVNVDVVRALLGVLPPGQSVRAVVASPSGLTADAMNLANSREVIVWDEARLAELESLVASL